MGRTTWTLALSALSLALTAFKQDPPKPATPPAPATTQAAKTDEGHQLWLKGRVERDTHVTLFYGAGHEQGKAMKPLLDKFIDAQKGEWVEAQESLHVLAINVEKSKEELIKRVVENLDLPPPQIILECHVAEITWNRDFEIGFHGNLGDFVIWRANNPGAILSSVSANFRPTSAVPGTPFQGSTFSFSAWPGGERSHTGQFASLLESFVRRGQARILSEPHLMVNSGGEAKFSSLEEIPIPNVTFQGLQILQQVVFKNVGTTVNLKPHIVGRNQVDIDVDITLSAVSDVVNFPVGASSVSVPVVTSRQTSTHLIVNDNQEIVISGLVRRVESETRRGFPFISEIPLIGYLFGSTDTEERLQELFFIIRPRIVHEQLRPSPELLDPFRDDKDK